MNEHEIYNRHQNELAQKLEKRFSIIEKKLELIAKHTKAPVNFGAYTLEGILLDNEEWKEIK